MKKTMELTDIKILFWHDEVTIFTCGEHCGNNSHYYVLTCCFAGGFYNSKKITEDIEFIKKLEKT